MEYTLTVLYGAFCKCRTAWRILHIVAAKLLLMQLILQCVILSPTLKENPVYNTIEREILYLGLI